MEEDTMRKREWLAVAIAVGLCMSASVSFAGTAPAKTEMAPVIGTVFSPQPQVGMITGGGDFSEDWESFNEGDEPCGTNGWEKWLGGGGDVCGHINAVFSNSGINSLEIVGATGPAGDDTVQQFSIDGGLWVMKLMTYIQSNASGDGWVILLNTYQGSQNWSVQVRWENASGLVVADFDLESTPIIYDEWIEFRVEINLGTDEVDYYYDNVQFIDNKSWVDGVSGNGSPTIAALDLYGGEPGSGGVTAIYFDDIMMTGQRGACCLPDGSCTDDVPGGECPGRFAADTLCEDIEPPCVELTGRCCIEGGGGCTRDPAWVCDGDTDGDGQVNPVDSGLVQARFGSTDEQDLCNYDLDCDGQINPVDSGIVQSLFGTCNAPRESCGGGGGDPECAEITATECRARGGEFGGYGTDCADDACGFAEGACCIYPDCLGTMRNAECEDLGGAWFEGETCPEFACPEVIDCFWDNDVNPNGINGRAISPPSFPDIRVVDDVTFNDPGCEIGTLHANVIEDAGWTPGDTITVYAYEDTGNGPGALMASVDTSFRREDTGNQYFGRQDYEYWIEGVGLELPGGTSWIGMRNAGGGGAGTNYWMTSDGGADGGGSDTGWFSLDGGNTFQPEGATWHHAFEITLPPGNGACCLPDGSCTDDVPSNECRDLGGRFARETLCEDLNPPCEEQTGRCCIDGDNPECAVITATECGQQGGTFGGYGTDCAGDPCGFAEGACCLDLDCAGTTRKAACDDLGGAWYIGQTCPEFTCPDVVGCAWDNGIVPNGVNGRAISPPSFPDIRVVDDVVAESPGCTILSFHANVIEDGGWSDDGMIQVLVYEDTGNGPGGLMASVDLEYTKMATGDNYFGRDDYDYWVEGVGIDLPVGTSWVGIRNPGGAGAGTNYWMTSDGGFDGSGSDTGWFSLDGGNTFSAEGDTWHHAFEIIP
jgi:hypothetical protein